MRSLRIIRVFAEDGSTHVFMFLVEPEEEPLPAGVEFVYAERDCHYSQELPV
jgi:hypothetical protein